MAKKSKNEAALIEFLTREGVDVDAFMQEKETLMERKHVHGRRMQLSLRMPVPPKYVEVEEEDRR